MPATLDRKIAASTPQTATSKTASGLRRWTLEEYHRLKQSGFFGEERSELLMGLVWHPEDAEPRHWTREEYYRLGEMGFFDDERVELLNGGIWKLPPQNTPHFTAVRRTTDALEELFGAGYEVRPQGPFSLPNGAEPEPDILVVPGTAEDYADSHPLVTDVILLVEVSDSTLGKDIGPKRVSYAQAGVQDYWVVDLVHRQLEVSRQPSLEGIYADVQTYLPGDSIAPLGMPTKKVAVSDLLPPMKETN